MKTESKKDIKIIALILSIVILAFGFLYFINNSDYYSKDLVFKEEYIKNGQVEIKILDVEYFDEDYSYVFTDKGRLVINNKEKILNYSLYQKIKNECLNKTAQATVSIKSWQIDWRLNKINCK